MIKLKLKKISILFYLFILLIYFFNSNISNAATSNYFGKINSETIFSSNYSFSPKFIKNITTTQSSGMTNYYTDTYRTGSTQLSLNTYYSARLTSNSQKGKIWVRYNNVGTYNNQIIDLKITLSGWNYLQPANKSASTDIGTANYPTVFFKKDDIDVLTTSIPAIDSPQWTFAYYLSGTNTIISSIKSHITFKDIDGGPTGENEMILFKSGIDSVYITPESYLTLTSAKCINASSFTLDNNEKNGWATCLTSGTLSFTYTRNKDIKGNSYRDITQTAPSNRRAVYHFLISSESIAPFEFSTPIKSCNKEKLRGLEETKYTISHYIPGESTNFYYTNYILTDEFPDCFDITDIYISDDSKTNRTTWFSISKNENTVTISAKSNVLTSSSFYNNNFYFDITVAKKSDKTIANYYNDKDLCIIPNTAQIQITAPSINSTRNNMVRTNTVNITLFKEFLLPATGGNGDSIFIFSGFILIFIFLILNSRRFI